METHGSPKHATPTGLLVTGLLFVAITFASVAFGNTGNDLKKVALTPTTTTPVTAYEFPTSSIVVTTTTIPPTTTTTAKVASGTKKPTTVTTIAGGPCASAPAGSAAGTSTAPAVGTYKYGSCNGANDVPSLTVGAGTNSGGVTRRTIKSESGLGELTATDAFGPNGVMQESATIVAFGFTLNCDWMPDITEYAAKLAIGASWNADSSCDLGNGAKLRLVATRKITGAATFDVGGTKVSAWVIDETEKLTITAPGRGPSNVTSASTNYYDPTHGLTVYAKTTTDATGAFEQPKTTSETYLTSLTPKA